MTDRLKVIAGFVLCLWLWAQIIFPLAFSAGWVSRGAAFWGCALSNWAFIAFLIYFGVQWDRHQGRGDGA